MDNFGLLTYHRPASVDELEAFDGILELTQKRSQPFGKTIQDEVKLAVFGALAVIVGPSEPAESIEECSYLKFVSIVST